jgi:hypothetical protein
VIKIRYRDADELSPGLHAAAVNHGRDTTVYLLPGLTTAERRAALRRLRLSARMGYCPRLPAVQLALALAADRIRTTVGQVGTLVRSHPAGSTVPVMVLSAGAIAFLALSAVSIQVLHVPPDPGRPSALAVPGGHPATGAPSSAPSQDPAPAGPGGPGPADPGTRVVSSRPGAGETPRPAPSASPSPSDATPSAGTVTAPRPNYTIYGTPSPAASPAPSSASPGPPVMQVAPAPGPSSPCLTMGPGGTCP